MHGKLSYMCVYTYRSPHHIYTDTVPVDINYVHIFLQREDLKKYVTGPSYISCHVLSIFADTSFHFNKLQP